MTEVRWQVQYVALTAPNLASPETLWLDAGPPYVSLEVAANAIFYVWAELFMFTRVVQVTTRRL